MSVRFKHHRDLVLLAKRLKHLGHHLLHLRKAFRTSQKPSIPQKSLRISMRNHPEVPRILLRELLQDLGLFRHEGLELLAFPEPLQRL